jgi:hypothetical protein
MHAFWIIISLTAIHAAYVNADCELNDVCCEKFSTIVTTDGQNCKFSTKTPLQRIEITLEHSGTIYDGTNCPSGSSHVCCQYIYPCSDVAFAPTCQMMEWTDYYGANCTTESEE